MRFTGLLESEFLLAVQEIDRILIADCVIKKMGFPEWKMEFTKIPTVPEAGRMGHPAGGEGKSGERSLVARGALSG
jgi:hypothetical protein